jgi:release factor glutamine methyltransferase
MSARRNVKQLIELGTRVLEDSTHIFEDHLNEDEARGLLAFTLKIDDDELDELSPGFEPTTRQSEKYLSLIARRAAGEPFPFLVGRTEFYGLELKVKPGAFVPRPSSELTVEWAVKRLRRMKSPTVVDVCAGAGPIALAIADEIDSADVWALDVLNEGLSQGRANATRLGIKNVTFRRGDMYGPLPKRLLGGVDLITGHIPYVPIDELDDLPSEVREHEPLETLTDHSDDGLILMARAIEEGVPWLKPGGWLLLEMSDDITGKVRRMCKGAGLEDHGVVTDDDDLSVVVEARLPL